jgi:hypothetical protein
MFAISKAADLNKQVWGGQLYWALPLQLVLPGSTRKSTLYMRKLRLLTYIIVLKSCIPRNTDWKGSLSTIDLHIKEARFARKYIKYTIYKEA